MKLFKKALIAMFGIALLTTTALATLTNFPNGVSSFGVPVIGSGDLTTTGTIYFVSSVSGSNSNPGTEVDKPFSTLTYALGKLTASKGDIIAVMPGHTETLTAACTLSADDSRIVGVGPSRGSALITSATADINLIDITGDDTTVENLRFSNTATLTTTCEMLDVGASRVIIKNCEFDFADTASVEGINLATGEVDNVVMGCTFINPNDGESCVLFGGARTKIVNNDFDLSGGDGLGLEQIATAQNGAVIAYNTFSGDGTSQECISWQSAPGDGHSVIRNWVTAIQSDIDCFGDDTDLDYQFIENYNGAVDGSTTVIDPSP